MAIPMMMTRAVPYDDDIFALSLQLEEIEAQRGLQTGKWRENSPPDFALAFIDFEAELRKAIQLVEDLKLARSIAQAVDEDWELLARLAAEESQARQDRGIALRFLNDESYNPELDAAAVTVTDGGSSSFATWEDLALERAERSLAREDAQSVCENESAASSSIAGPSVPYTLRRPQAPQNLGPLNKLECAACTVEFHPHEAVRLDCDAGHVYCKDCLRRLFILSTTDEFHFPPKCCGANIPVSLVEGVLSPEESKAFREAEVEYTTGSRLYCAEPACGRFLPLRNAAEDRAHCDLCGNETCTHCRKAAHEGDCPEDEALEGFMALATERDWQRCFRCRAMVERPYGCDHMTCRCSAEFCYKCGVKWKECSCDDWQLELRQQRAQQVVDREAVHPLPLAERRLRVRAMEEELQRNHECEHRGRWERLEGSRRRRFTCEFCGDQHKNYILSCRHCHVTACESCRRHRV